MISLDASRKLRHAVVSFHQVGDAQYHFAQTIVSTSHEVTALYMRIAADLIEAREEIDLLKGFESHAFYLTDMEDEIVSLVLTSHDADTQTLVIDFGWTHPGVRRLGLFRKLIDIVVECMWETKSIKRLRSAPPVQDPIYDAVMTKLGFTPISLVSEYRPYS